MILSFCFHTNTHVHQNLCKEAPNGKKKKISTPDNVDTLMIILAHRLGWDGERRSL